MRASSKSLPFTEISIHSNKFSEDDTGYESLQNQSDKHQRIKSIGGLSSSSSSTNNVINFVMDCVKNTPSPINLATGNDSNEAVSRVAQIAAKFSQKHQSPIATPIHKIKRKRVRPMVNSTSDSTDSFALSNHPAFISPSFGGTLDYVHDDRFDSTTTVDHVKNDIIAIELAEQQKKTSQLVESIPQQKEKTISWINRLGESIRLLPANVIAVVFMSLIGAIFVSALFVIIIA